MTPSVLLLGAGRMGSALFSAWVKAGLAPSLIVDPELPGAIARPEDRLVRSLDALVGALSVDAVILAIKPQMAPSVLPALGERLPPGAVVISILAGLGVARLHALLGSGNPIVRAMPNTPAAIGQGMTVAYPGPGVSTPQHDLAEQLLSAVGAFAWLDDETLIDPITAISGSGPAYVFLLAELLEQGAIEHGVPPELARRLARQTVAGAGALLAASPADSAALRQAVTSPRGTTQAALEVLMAPDAWPATLRGALAAATARARAMGA